MYSKSLAAGDGHARGDVRSAGGAREPAYRRVVRVPRNYSGHAFRDGEERSPEQMMGVVTSDVPYGNRDGSPYGGNPPCPHFDGLPRVSTLGRRDMEPSPQPMERERPRGALLEENVNAPVDETTCDSSSVKDGPPPMPTCDESTQECEREGRGKSGLYRGLSERFPFGHGFGFDELLLVGLMLVLLHEGDGEGDLGETLVLLGVLLLCG